MLGYLDDEEATSHVITEDGWFRTGDLGEFTPDGLRILGRKDRTFKLTNGEKVHPLRIENLLCGESPYISLALVLGSLGISHVLYQKLASFIHIGVNFVGGNGRPGQMHTDVATDLPYPDR